MPPGRAYLDLRGVLTPEVAAVLLEGGWRPREGITLYGYGQAEKPRHGPLRAVAGLGARVEF